MEAPGNMYEKLCLAYDTRIVELKAEFFRRAAKLTQCFEQLADVSVPTLSEICTFLRDTYELAQSDYEAAITTGIWQIPPFVELFSKTLERALQHSEKLLMRHLKAKNLAGVTNVLGIVTVLPASIDLAKVFFHSVLELLSEDYEETLFDSPNDPVLEQLSLYSLHRSHLWKLNSSRTPGSRWLMYECDQSCYQDDFYENCYSGFYRSILAEMFHTHAVLRNMMRVGNQTGFDPYAFLTTAGEIVQTQIIALNRRKPNPSSVLRSLALFSNAREQLQLESSRSASFILTPAYFSFLVLLQTAAHYYAKELSSNAQGDSTLHKLMWMYGNISEFLYCFFGMRKEPRPYVERLVSEYEMEWQKDSVVCARDSEVPSIINWLRYMRCLSLDLFRIRIHSFVSQVCHDLSPSAYDLPKDDPEPRSFVSKLLDLLTAHYEQSGLVGKSNRVMIRKTLAVFVTVMFRETRKVIKEICTTMTISGVGRLAKDVSMMLDGVCGLGTVRGKTGYAGKIRGLREVQKWREVLLCLLSDETDHLSEKLRRWRAKLRDARGDRRKYFDVSMLQMQIMT